VSFGDIGTRERGAASSGVARPLGAILSDLRVQIALAGLTVSQFVMIATTSTSPVYLHDHGHPVHTIGLAVSFHLGGMYVTSPLSGWLCDRFGRLPMIGAGALLLIVAVTVAGLAPGESSVLVILGIFLNGVGWNLAFVSASALLTDALSPSERASIQGLADLFMGLMGALGSAVGGMILGIWGFTVLNGLGALLALAPLVISLRRPALAPRESGVPSAGGG
jgi:MFS family permease